MTNNQDDTTPDEPVFGGEDSDEDHHSLGGTGAGIDASDIESDDGDADDELAVEESSWVADQYEAAKESDVGTRVGRGLAAPFIWLLAQLGDLAYAFTYAFSRVLGGENLWRNLIKTGYKGLLKSTKEADAIMHIMHKGQLIHEPVAWDKDEQHYRTRDKEEWWNAPSEGAHLYTAYSSVPTMWASSDANHVGDHVQAEVAEALEFGEDRPVYEDATVEMVIDATQEPSAGAAGGDASAVTDGGSVGVTDVSVQNPGVLSDFVVPLNSGSKADGRVVSGHKYYETYPETVATEEMQRQEWRGREAERDMDAMMDQIKKIVLYAFIAVIGTVALFVLGPEIVGGGGGGGGGGGSIIPLFQSLPLGVF